VTTTSSRRNFLRTLNMAASAIFMFSLNVHASDDSDPYQWLENTGSADVIEWVESQNKETVEQLTKEPGFDQLRARFLSLYQSDDRLPGFGELRQHRGMVYALEQSTEHPRGVLRRVSVESYGRSSAPWEVLVDIDAIADEEGKNWYTPLFRLSFSPDGSRVLLGLSDGGSEAISYREFDLHKREFVKGGFSTPVARQFAVWENENTLQIAIVLASDEATESGYPRIVRRWQRGTDLRSAQSVYEGSRSHVLIAPTIASSASYSKPLILDAKTFSEGSVYAVDDQKGLVKLEFPQEVMDFAWVGLHGIDQTIFLSLQADWAVGGQVFRAGDVVGVNLRKIIAQGGKSAGAVETVYSSAENQAIRLNDGVVVSKDTLLVNALCDVISCLKSIALDDKGSWVTQDVQLPGQGTVNAVGGTDVYSPVSLWTYESFLTAPQLLAIEQNAAPTVRAQQVPFDGHEEFETTQMFALAKDGTKIPYFVVHKKRLKLDGSSPVVMYGYGGFGLSVPASYEPRYIGPFHDIWLKQGGIFVSVNPRGGGEYGPKWYSVAKRQTRQTVYDDIYAVTEDLIQRGFTAKGKVGFVGGSNGGLTAGVVATQRPDLFGASVSLVPLLDMMRFHKLLAGASWMDEYGNPEVDADREALLGYSPYQNIDVDAKYPEIFFMTSTQDDHVHPGHARKMAAKMMASGHPTLFYEAKEGGHAMAVNDEGRAFNSAMITSYFIRQLMTTRDH